MLQALDLAQVILTNTAVHSIVVVLVLSGQTNLGIKLLWSDISEGDI